MMPCKEREFPFLLFYFSSCSLVCPMSETEAMKFKSNSHQTTVILSKNKQSCLENCWELDFVKSKCNGSIRIGLLMWSLGWITYFDYIGLFII